MPATPAPGGLRPAPKTDTVKKVVEPTYAEAPGLTRLEMGGTFQLKAFFHDITADADADKSLSFQMRRARVDFQGRVGDHFSFEAQLTCKATARRSTPRPIYLAWKFNDFIGIRGGKIKRTFSQEALQSSKDLYTIERGIAVPGLPGGHHRVFLLRPGRRLPRRLRGRGRAGDLRGRHLQRQAEQQRRRRAMPTSNMSGSDPALKAKDFAFRLAVQPFKPLKMEACISTKAAEDTSDPENFSYSVNTAYEVGMDLLLGRLRLLGEAAWGDNQQGVDAKIISGSSLFFAFYGTGVWREDYSRGRASELVLQARRPGPGLRARLRRRGRQ